MNKLQKLLSIKYLALLPLIIILLLLSACEKKIDKKEKEALDNNNALISLVLTTFSGNDYKVLPIDTETKKGSVIVPYDTNLSKLKVKSLEFSPLAKCSINVGDTITLTKDKTFDLTITAQNGDKADYTISVFNSNNALISLVLTFSGNDYKVLPIDVNTKTGTVGIPHSTADDLNGLEVKSVDFSPSARCSIEAGDVIPLDSNKTFKITVTAQDGSEAIYTISIISPRKEKNFLSFSFLQSADSRLKGDATFNINGTNITGTVIYLESNKLKPVFTVSPGATVKVGNAVQTSGESEQDFTSTVTYTVIPEDTKEAPKTYTVVVNFKYDKLNVTSAGVLTRKDMNNPLTGKLVLAEKMNGYIVKSIGEKAFYECEGLTGSLIFPNTIESIGARAFWNCKEFTGALTLPNFIKNIGDGAFRGCSGFTGALTLPSDITTIKSYTFRGCSGFTGALFIPNKVTTINSSAFRKCKGFTALTLPNSISILGIFAFEGCTGFKGALTLPSNIGEIREGAFRGCSGFTGALTLPNSISILGTSAFEDCSGFTGSLTIPNQLVSVRNATFSDCSGFDGTLTIPDNITDIDAAAFNDCSKFKTLILSNKLKTIGFNAFGNCKGFKGSLTIPDTVTSIEKRAFEDCSGFDESLIIPISVTSIGEKAFKGCSGFKRLCNKSNAPPGADAFAGVTQNTAFCP